MQTSVLAERLVSSRHGDPVSETEKKSLVLHLMALFRKMPSHSSTNSVIVQLIAVITIIIIIIIIIMIIIIIIIIIINVHQS